METRGNNLGFLSTVLSIIVVYLISSKAIFAADIIVNKSVPDADCSLEDIRAIFTTKQRHWLNGKPIRVYTLSDNHSVHKNFVKTVLLLFPHQIRRIWDRNTFSGTGSAPSELASEQEMLEKIATTPDSIGYLDNAPHNDNVRVLKVH